jgi:hypothetical protein
LQNERSQEVPTNHIKMERSGGLRQAGRLPGSGGLGQCTEELFLIHPHPLPPSQRMTHLEKVNSRNPS